jgi:hypothetical protein
MPILKVASQTNIGTFTEKAQTVIFLDKKVQQFGSINKKKVLAEQILME